MVAASAACLVVSAQGVGRCDQRGGITQRLIDAADYIGFASVSAQQNDDASGWKQNAEVYNYDALKGSLLPPLTNRRWVGVFGDGPRIAGVPNQYSATTTYLVFLRRRWETARWDWVTLAAFRVQYHYSRAGGDGTTMMQDGALDHVKWVQYVRASLDPPYPQYDYPDPAGLPLRAAGAAPMTMALARKLLVTLLTRKGDVQDAGLQMDGFIHQAIETEDRQEAPARPSFATRFEEAQALAATVKIGTTTRAEVEALFPVHDGGLAGPDGGRYYFGSEVKIEVPYNWTETGAWSPGNTVNGPIRIYRSPMNWG